MLVEALFPQPRIETLDVGVLNRLAGCDKLQFHPMLVSPLIEHPTAKLRSIVGLNHQRQPALAAEPLQYSDYAFAGQRNVDFDGEALPTPFVKHRKSPKPAPVEQAVVNEIDRPRLVCCQWLRAHHAQVTQPFAPSPSAQGQPFLPIQPLDALVIGLPTLAAQQLIEHRTAPAAPLLGQLTQPLP